MANFFAKLLKLKTYIRLKLVKWFSFAFSKQMKTTYGLIWTELYFLDWRWNVSIHWKKLKLVYVSPVVCFINKNPEMQIFLCRCIKTWSATDNIWYRFLLGKILFYIICFKTIQPFFNVLSNVTWMKWFTLNSLFC